MYKSDESLNHSHSDENIFLSKSFVLKFLKKQLKFSHIEKIFSFTIKEWEKNETKILKQIKTNFPLQLIIVRSSAMGEDSLYESQAGNYESILNVDAKSISKTRSAICDVINSYEKKGNNNSKNEILIQTQTSNIVLNGVAFTREPTSGSPYFVINFNDDTSSDSVTKGQTTQTIKIYKNSIVSKIPKKWKILIKSLKEIEYVTKHNSLDIEFAITKKNEVTIFQARPITTIKNPFSRNVDKKLSESINISQKKFLKHKNTKLLGKKTIFSDMADWNPAEIIGNNPNPLDYSLYDYLIMKKIWHKSRSKIGYQNINSCLMQKFGNKPYVDVKASFNSLVPDSLPKNLKIKLINFYLEKLDRNPHLHDKVEFEILLTCYELSLSDKLKELKKAGFTQKESKKIHNELLQLTNNVINIFPDFLKECETSTQILNENREQIHQKINSSNNNFKFLIESAQILLEDCKKFGTMPFSTMARIAFIASIILKSLNHQKHLDPNFVDIFMNSISSPVTEIQDDLEQLMKKNISQNEFLKKYGHLRPGTYDITALRYDDENKFFENIKFLKTKKTKINFKNTSVDKILKKHGLKFDKISFFEFTKNALVQRENLKFNFTRNLSDAIELIAKAGETLGLTRIEMAHLDIETILKIKNKSKSEISKILKSKIKQNISKKIINDNLFLPPLLFTENDFEIIQYYVSKPNFITNDAVTGNLVKLKNFNDQVSEISSNIVLIENADPGFDWIFTKNPSGLITKYGGVASHMAIRCAELKLPAAIGCGEVLYEKLLGSSKIILDCNNQQITILEHQIDDEYIEEKKILKSLGYIK